MFLYRLLCIGYNESTEQTLNHTYTHLGFKKATAMTKGSGQIRSLKFISNRSLAMLAVVAFVAMIYGRTVTFGFIEHDDDRNIYENHRLLNPTVETFTSYWTEPYLGLFIPATYTYWTAVSAWSNSWSHEDGFKKPDPKWFHLGNVILHGANGLLVLTLLSSVGFSSVAATFGALFFVAHPLQVEAVAWASGAKDVWSSFWGLLSLVTFLQFLTRPVSAEKKYLGLVPLFLSYLFFSIAILAKPSQVVIPVMGALLIYYHDRKINLHRVKILLPYMVILGIYLTLANLSQGAEGSFKQVPLALRPLIAGDAINFYATKILFPLNLAVDYARPPTTVINSNIALALSTFTLMFLTATALVWLRHKNQSFNTITVSIWLFVVGLTPVLGLVPFGYQFFSTVCDRYAYLAMLSPALVVAMLQQHVRKSRGVLTTILIAYVTSLGFGTLRQVDYWQNESKLFKHSLEVQPDGAVALIGFSNELAKQGDWNGTIPLLTRARQSLPDWARPHNNLGTSFVNLNRFEEAADELALAVKLRPVYPLAWSNRCSVLRQLKRFKESLHDCKIATVQAPDFAPAHLNLALTLSELGDWKSAELSYAKALALNPNNYDSIFFWALALRERGRYQEAANQLSKLFQLYPSSEEALRELNQTIGQMKASEIPKNSPN